MKFQPRPKFEYVRSKPLMEAYRRLACQHCGAQDGTVAGAHSNWAEHGKGRSIKASDVFCASLCYRCHSFLDQGSWTADQSRSVWDVSHAKTIAALIELSWSDHKLRAVLVKVGICKG